MGKHVYTLNNNSFPKELPILPLTEAVLLPEGKLPLNIFDQAHIALVNHAMATNHLIGIIRPKNRGSQTLFDIGCAGEIIEINEISDSFYEITIEGISRFKIEHELRPKNGYRRIKPNWGSYIADRKSEEMTALERIEFRSLLRKYFDRYNMECDWDHINNAPIGELMTRISMIFPFGPEEKQTLLEMHDIHKQIKFFNLMLEMALHHPTYDIISNDMQTPLH